VDESGAHVAASALGERVGGLDASGRRLKRRAAARALSDATEAVAERSRRAIRAQHT
jgi:hypothetical protein